jgi:phosphate-selective porin OprO and OprP
VGRNWCLLTLACALLPALAGAQIRLEDPARPLRLEIGGVVQPRYEHTSRQGEEDLSSFFMRRVRLDLRGSVLDPRLTFRILPELNRSATLRDAWLDFAFSPQARVRFGQLQVPFQWHRFVSPSRQHFAERGLPSETFGFPDGRDIGVLFHGESPGRTMAWGVGIFDGAGRNIQHSHSSGHMATGRLGVALLGDLPREEGDLARRPTPGLAFGLGLQGATRNEVRAWDLGRSPGGNRRANWATATLDASFRWNGASLVAEVYRRRVDPDDPAVDRYDGEAFHLSAGYFLVPGRLEGVARYSELHLDREAPGTREREWGVGLNLSHRGHDSKVRAQYLAHERQIAGVFRTTGTFLVDYYLQF